MEAGRPTAGSSRAGGHRASTIASPWRLDPFSLPVRFFAADHTADGALRVVDLHRERVVLRRARAGMRMAVNLPVAAYRGVAIKLFAEADKPPHMFAVTLEHADTALSLLLFSQPRRLGTAQPWWGYPGWDREYRCARPCPAAERSREATTRLHRQAAQ